MPLSPRLKKLVLRPVLAGLLLFAGCNALMKHHITERYPNGGPKRRETVSLTYRFMDFGGNNGWDWTENGLRTTWYENGQKSFEGAFYDAGFHPGGIHRWWAPNGLLTDEWRIGSDGRRLVYFENGRLKSETTTKEGQLEGPQSQWSPDGELLDAWTFVHGRPISGTHRLYSEDGEVAKETEYIEGFWRMGYDHDFEKTLPLRSAETEYYPGGALKSQAQYLHGQADGDSRAWDPAGRLVQEDRFEYGVKATGRSWYDDGAKKSEEGAWGGRWWGPDGRKVRELKIEGPTRVETVYFGNGKPEHQVTTKPQAKTVDTVWYFSNGQKKRLEKTREDHLLESVDWDRNGKVTAIVTNPY